MPGSTTTADRAAYATAQAARPKRQHYAQALAQARSRIQTNRKKRTTREPWSPENQ